MKKNNLIAGALILLIAALAGWFLLDDRREAKNLPENKNEEPAVPFKDDQRVGLETFTGGINSILALERPLRCEWKQGENESGLAYFKGNRYYAEFTAQEGAGFVLVSGNCMWTWSEGAPSGVKVCLGSENETFWKSAEGLKQENSPVPEGSVVSSDVEYRCEAASVSDEKFNAPAGIDFITAQDLMTGGFFGE